MTLKREDYAAILRVLRSQLRETDPDAVDAVDRAADVRDEDLSGAEDLKRVVLRYLDALMKVLGERSGGGKGRVLDLANQYIRTTHGGPIEALTVELSPLDRELHQSSSLDLATLPDRSAFLEQLRNLRRDIEHDDINEGGPR